jgi:hypothetical protein
MEFMVDLCFFFNGILIVGFWWDFMEDLKGTYVIWWGY